MENVSRSFSLDERKTVARERRRTIKSVTLGE
jgi:hypothetical protein